MVLLYELYLPTPFWFFISSFLLWTNVVFWILSKHCLWRSYHFVQVPPDAVEPLFKQVVNQFVHDRSRPEVLLHSACLWIGFWNGLLAFGWLFFFCLLVGHCCWLECCSGDMHAHAFGIASLPTAFIIAICAKLGSFIYYSSCTIFVDLLKCWSVGNPESHVESTFFLKKISERYDTYQMRFILLF